MTFTASSEELADLLLAPAAPGELASRIAALAPALDLATVATLKERVDATKLRNARRALAIADVAVAVAAHVSDPVAPGLALWARGNALYHLSRYREALGCYRRAEAYYAGQALEVARLQINQVAVLQDLGAFDEALATAEAARAICERIGAPAQRFLALLEMNSGAAFQQLARPAEALAAYERGRAIFVALGDSIEAARMDINRANVVQEMGRFAEAEALYRAASATLAAAGADQEVARAEHNLGKLAYRRGRFQEALAHLERARTGYAAIPNPLEVAKADLYRALVYRDLGLLDESVELARAAGESFARERTRWEQAIALTVEGTGLARLGAIDAAAPLLDRARRLLRRQGATERIPPLDLDRAELALAAGNLNRARRLAARVARGTDPELWPALAARALLALAACELAAGHHASAAGLAQGALELATRYELPEAAAAHHAIARAHELSGDHEAAWVAQNAATAAAEELRARLPLDDLRLAFLETHEPIYRDGVRLAWRRGDPAATLAAVSLAFSAPLPRPGLPPGDPALREQLRELREAWAYLQSSLDGGEEGLGTGAPELARRLRELERAIADVSRRLAVGSAPTGDQRPTTDDRRPTTDDGPPSSSPTSSAVGGQWSVVSGRSSAVDARSLQAGLAADEALLVYAPAGDTAFGLAVTSTTIQQQELPLSAAGLARLLRSWRFHVGHAYGVAAEPAAHAAARAHLTRLYDGMVAPLLAALPQARRLVVCLPPEWHDLPLAAALGPDGHLIERYTLSFVAAPAALERRAPPPLAGPALVLGCSDDGRLPEALREAEAVALALGRRGEVHGLMEHEATRTAVTEALSTCGVAHLASHAAFRPDNPLFSWVRLADGHLAVADLGELSLRGRPLVVLSACETGRGRPRGGGIVGMARGFLLAGAAALITSLWKIADASSARLMTDFYGALAAGRPDPAAALAAAQRRALARGEHPFHWAAFVCVEA